MSAQRTTQYTRSHRLIVEALSIPTEKYPLLLKKMKDRQLLLLMSELQHAIEHIQQAVANTAKFEVKPSPAQYRDAQQAAPVLQAICRELGQRSKPQQQGGTGDRQ